MQLLTPLGVGTPAREWAYVVSGGALVTAATTQYCNEAIPEFNENCTVLAISYVSIPSILHSGGVTLAAMHHYEVADIGVMAGNTVTRQIGYHCPDLVNADENWAFYSDSAESFFGGDVTVVSCLRLGTSETLNHSRIEVADGAATATDARWMFRNGTDSHAALRIISNDADGVTLDAVEAGDSSSKDLYLQTLSGQNVCVGTTTVVGKLTVGSLSTSLPVALVAATGDNARLRLDNAGTTGAGGYHGVEFYESGVSKFVVYRDVVSTYLATTAPGFELIGGHVQLANGYRVLGRVAAGTSRMLVGSSGDKVLVGDAAGWTDVELYTGFGLGLVVRNNGRTGVGGVTAPITMLSNVASAIDDGATGTNASAITWAVNGAGWAASFANLSAVTAANGLLIDTAGATVNQKCLRIVAGASGSANTHVMTVFGDASIMVGSVASNMGAGTINAKGLYDDGVITADYIFDMAYDGLELPTIHPILTIDQTIAFVRKNRHLPSMPGAEDIKKRGKRSVGALLTSLWETVERMQLHIESEHEENAILRERVRVLEEKERSRAS